MSQRAGESDVEDVVSSVKRLIAGENRRPISESVTPARLVLSPALRVHEPEDTGPDTPTDDATESPPPTADHVNFTFSDPDDAVRDTSLEERIAELEAAVASRPEEWEPDGSEDQAQHRPDRVVLSRERGTPLRLSRISLVQPEIDDDDEIMPEPDEAPADHDRIEDAVVLAEVAPQPAPAEYETVEDEDEDEAILFEDESELRALVSTLIREELQGELGERITRNVRKLVRREIQRALAARDLN